VEQDTVAPGNGGGRPCGNRGGVPHHSTKNPPSNFEVGLGAKALKTPGPKFGQDTNPTGWGKEFLHGVGVLGEPGNLPWSHPKNPGVEGEGRKLATPHLIRVCGGGSWPNTRLGTQLKEGGEHCLNLFLPTLVVCGDPAGGGLLSCAGRPPKPTKKMGDEMVFPPLLLVDHPHPHFPPMGFSTMFQPSPGGERVQKTTTPWVCSWTNFPPPVFLTPPQIPRTDPLP